jgi:predicted permease
MIKLAPPGLIPGAERIGMDVRVLAFAMGLSLLTAALVGVWPAVRASGAHLVETLHDGGRTTAGTMHAARFRRLLVVAETALALVLLVCSALVLQSLSNILGVDPGFQVDRVVAMRVTLSPAAYPDSTFVAFYRELTTRLVGRAGIEAAAAANTPPLSSGGVVPQIRPIGKPNGTGEPMMSATTAITPGYFRTAGIRLIAGRDIAWSDPQPVLVLSQSAARRLWPGEDVLGKRIAFGQRDTVGLEIVGVVSDSRARGLTADPVPMIYMSFGGALNVVRTMSLLVRGADPASIMTATRAVVHELDPKLPLYNVQTLREIVDRSIAQPRLNTTLLTLFAAMALLLATVGIYGVVSYTVALRSQELGLRMALGAQRRDVLQLVLREGALLALGGVMIGVVASFGATRVIRSWLFGIGPGDATTLVVVSIALGGVALMASYVPARRATRVDPTLAMRAE